MPSGRRGRERRAHALSRSRQVAAAPRGRSYRRQSSVGKRRQEALVLRRGAVGDADVAGAAERRAGADDDPGAAEALDDLGLVAVGAEVDPGEVGLGVGRASAPCSRSSSSTPIRSATVLLDPVERRRRRGRIASAPAACESRLTLNGWRTASTAARKPGRAERVAAAQPGEAVDLAERPQQDEVGEAREAGRRVASGIVERPASRRRPRRGSRSRGRGPRSRNAAIRCGGQAGAGRVVRVADDHELGRRGDLGQPSRRGRARSRRRAGRGSRGRPRAARAAGTSRTTARRRRARRPARRARARRRAGSRRSRWRRRSRPGRGRSARRCRRRSSDAYWSG